MRTTALMVVITAPAVGPACRPSSSSTEAVATANGRLEETPRRNCEGTWRRQDELARELRLHGGTQHDARCRVCRPHLSGLLRCRAGLAMNPHCSRSRRLNVLCTFCIPLLFILSQRTKLSRLIRCILCVFLISREGTLRLRTHTETLATAFLEPHSQAAVTPAPQLL